MRLLHKVVGSACLEKGTVTVSASVKLFQLGVGSSTAVMVPLAMVEFRRYEVATENQSRQWFAQSVKMRFVTKFQPKRLCLLHDGINNSNLQRTSLSVAVCD